MENSEKSVSENGSDRPWESYNTVYTTAKAGLGFEDSCQFFKISISGLVYSSPNYTRLRWIEKF